MGPTRPRTFIRARSHRAAIQTPYTWPQPKPRQHQPKSPCPAGAIHTWAQEFILHDSDRFAPFRVYPVPWCNCIERIGSEPVSDVVEAGSEPRFCILTMAFARWCTFAQEVRGCASGPAKSEGCERHKQAKLAWMGEVRAVRMVLESEAVVQSSIEAPSVQARWATTS